MNTAEIIMQQKKIAAEKERAEKKLTYDTIKKWFEENVYNCANQLLKRIANNYTQKPITKVVYNCICGMSNFPLGDGYSEQIGLTWNVKYYQNYSNVEYRVTFIDEFFKNIVIERNKYAEETFKLFESEMLFHTTLPDLLRKEGFIVKHSGCGCCEEITITLPI